jgi:hypothetical protein
MAGRFSADGAAVFFLADFDYATGKVTQGAWLWRQDLATGARTCLARADSPPHFYVGPLLSPDGTRLLWHRSDRAPGGYQLWVVRWRRVARGQGAGPWANEQRAGHLAGRRAHRLCLRPPGARPAGGVVAGRPARWTGSPGSRSFSRMQCWPERARTSSASTMSKARPAPRWSGGMASARCPTCRAAAACCPMPPCPAAAGWPRPMTPTPRTIWWPWRRMAVAG